MNEPKEIPYIIQPVAQGINTPVMKPLVATSKKQYMLSYTRNPWKFDASVMADILGPP
jgi:hypothetical protein